MNKQKIAGMTATEVVSDNFSDADYICCKAFFPVCPTRFAVCMVRSWRPAIETANHPWAGYQGKSCLLRHSPGGPRS